jgi:type IV fimbrial biogenesis protein FimT
MKHKQGGFTIIELMFTVVVLAVLLAIGIPNFRDFIRNSHMTAAANDLLSDINLTRSESVKRRVPVTLCRSTDGASCATGSGNFARWIVFVDDADASATNGADGNGVVDTGEAVLRDRSIDQNINASANGNLAVFRPSGFPNAAIAGTVTRVLFCDDRGSSISAGGLTAARGVVIGSTGRAEVSRDKAKIEQQVDSGGFGGCP